MSNLSTTRRRRQDEDAEQLHNRLRTAIQEGRVHVFTDQRMLDFQGSPVHRPWDHIIPLLVMMVMALLILLIGGVALGLVAMTLGTLAHVAGIKHFTAWRLRSRTIDYMLASPAHWHHMWQLGGVVLTLPGTFEPPCVAPRADWCKFARRTLGPMKAAAGTSQELTTMQTETPPPPQPSADEPAQEVLPP